MVFAASILAGVLQTHQAVAIAFQHYFMMSKKQTAIMLK
jgi:hypothetical protein